MTDEEDAENERKNRVVDACEHQIEGSRATGYKCIRCEARVAIVMFSRRAQPFTIDWDAEENQ